ncbi:MAG: hypothetical protein WC683_07175 [bacterium]
MNMIIRVFFDGQTGWHDVVPQAQTADQLKLEAAKAADAVESSGFWHGQVYHRPCRVLRAVIVDLDAPVVADDPDPVVIARPSATRRKQPLTAGDPNDPNYTPPA